MKINFEYPKIIFRRGPDYDCFLEETTLVALSLDTTMFYFHNYEMEYKEFCLKLLGFGFRITIHKETEDDIL